MSFAPRPRGSRSSAAPHLEPVIAPTAPFERDGFVGDVVFPTGLVETGDTLLVYYGAADACTAVVELSRNEVFGALQ